MPKIKEKNCTQKKKKKTKPAFSPKKKNNFHWREKEREEIKKKGEYGLTLVLKADCPFSWETCKKEKGSS
jgi:hypothetical protein